MVDARGRLNDKAQRRLRDAFKQHRLTLFVGAGVSIDSGLPDWRGFLRVLFLNSPRHREADFTLDILDAAVGEWFFNHSDTSLEILGRKIRASYGQDDSEFLRGIRVALYFGTHLYWLEVGPLDSSRRRALLRGNPTLDAILTLSRRTILGRRGLRRVVTYNYDNLLETMLPPRSTQAIWRPVTVRPRALPIYHVHGYVPVNESAESSRADDIVLTEDQYNRVANDPYSWTNLVQLQAMTDSVCLVVGMSLDDRNLRRLLDATSRVAQRPELYAFVKKPRAPQLGADDVRTIGRMAHDRFGEMRVHWPDDEKPTVDPEGVATADRVRRMMARHYRLDITRLTAILGDLGVQPLWYDDVNDIAPFISKIAT